MPIPNSEDYRGHTINGELILPSYTVVFGILISVLVNLVVANVEGTNKPLFEKYAVNMWFFLVALGGYCVALSADFNFRIYQSNSNSVSADFNFRIYQSNSNSVATAADNSISSNGYSVIAVVFGLLSTFSLVSTLFSLVIGYVILGISWICSAIFIVTYENGRLYKGPVLWIYNKFMQPVFENIKNQFSPPTSSPPCSPSAEQQPKEASNA